MKTNPYRQFMKIAACVSGIAALVALIGGIIMIFAKDAQNVLVYVVIAGAASAILAAVALIVALSKSISKREREESDLFRDFHLFANGEKKVIPEQGQFYKDVRREFNRANLTKRDTLPYGDYGEDTFDDIVLDTLEHNLTSSAGLAYLELVAPSPVRSREPVKALLSMAKNHFGEKAYFGTLENGVAVFVPYLGSHEEMMGKVRKVVQLYSYSEEENHINAKAGIAFYPELAPRNLTSSALKATVLAHPLHESAAEAQVPLVGYKASEVVSIMYAGKMLTEKLQKPLTRAECSEAFAHFAKIALSSLGADSVNVFTRDIARDCFVLEEEMTKNDAAGFSRLCQEGIVPSEVLQPIFDWSVGEKGAVSATKAVYLPESIKSRLDNLGMLSIMALAVQIEDKPIGLLMVGSSQYELEMTYGAQRFFAYAERYLHTLIQVKGLNVHQARIDAMLGSFEHYAYAIAGGSYNLSYISPNLSKAIPEAKIGMACHKALFGLDEPCKDCPLFQIGIEKVMPSLSSGVFAFRALPGQDESIVVLSPHKADFLTSRLDELTGLLSDASLHEDLTNEILLKSNQGQVLGFRIRNADTLRGGFRLQSANEIVRVAAEALISARLARGVYRNGEVGFAYLLPFASKHDAIDLAEKVSKTLTVKLPFHDKKIELFLDFVLVSYPLEANDTFTLDSLFRVLYSKADASSRGRLFEVEHPEGRMVDYNYYARVKLEEGLRAGIMPVNYRPYDELAGHRTAFLDVTPAVLDEDGNIIDEHRLLSIADFIEKGTDSYVAMTRTIIKDIAKGKIHAPVIQRIAASCFNADFMRKVDELWAKERVEKKSLVFQVREDDLKDPNFKAFEAMCKEKGYPLGIGGYKADMESKDLEGFLFVNFSASEVYGAHKEQFLLGLSPVRYLGLNILVSDFQSKQERHYLSSLSFHYGLMKEQTKDKEEDELMEEEL